MDYTWDKATLVNCADGTYFDKHYEHYGPIPRKDRLTSATLVFATGSVNGWATPRMYANFYNPDGEFVVSMRNTPKESRAAGDFMPTGWQVRKTSYVPQDRDRSYAFCSRGPGFVWR